MATVYYEKDGLRHPACTPADHVQLQSEGWKLISPVEMRPNRIPDEVSSGVEDKPRRGRPRKESE